MRYKPTVKTAIISDTVSVNVCMKVSEIYENHKVIDMKFTTTTDSMYMYYTVLIVYEVLEEEDEEK